MYAFATNFLSFIEGILRTSIATLTRDKRWSAVRRLLPNAPLTFAYHFLPERCRKGNQMGAVILLPNKTH